MNPHPRIRKTVKWGGAFLALALAAAWLASGRWPVVWANYGRNHATIVELFAGRINASREKVSPPSVTEDSVGLYVRRTHRYWMHWRFAWGPTYVCVPLWPFLIVVGVAAGVAWHLDARAPRIAEARGCKSCGYDRRGLPSADGGAVCPECGEPGVTL